MRRGRTPPPRACAPAVGPEGINPQPPTLLALPHQLPAMAFSPAPTKSRPAAPQLTQHCAPTNPPFPAFNSKAGSSSPCARPLGPDRAILRRHRRGGHGPRGACLRVERANPARAPRCVPLTLGFVHQRQEAVAGARREEAGLRDAPPRGALASRPSPAPPKPGSGSARGSGGRGGAERSDQWWAVGRAGGRAGTRPGTGGARRPRPR